MKNKAFFFFIGSLLIVKGLFSFQLGLIGGSSTNPSHLNYGISGGMGFLIPMVGFEFELYKKTKKEEYENSNTITVGIKFKPKLGKFWPYAVVGLGMDFNRFTLNVKKDYRFTFVGGGIHYKVAAIFSLRLDLRFLNYSQFNRTRISTGLFFHF